MAAWLTAVVAGGALAVVAALARSDDKQSDPQQEKPMVALPNQMNNVRLGMLLKDRLPKLDGQPGFWTAPSGNFTVYIVTDEKHNRMRIMIPVQKLDKDDKDLPGKLLSANFDRALDVKYAVHDGVIWSLFMHPLRSLTEEALDNALKQVRTLAENTGTTFSSSDLIFGGGRDDK
jgi:hypothetical protein